MPDEPRHPIFEEVYPQFEFAPLVRIALYAAEWIKQRFARAPSEGASLRPSVPARASPDHNDLAGLQADPPFVRSEVG
jgi:hypothetical protein